jgi:hypothetical protein
VLDLELTHREVSGIARDQSRADTDCRGSDQAVGLTKRDAGPREIAAPSSGELTLAATERRNLQAPKKARHHFFLLGPGATQNLLYVHRTYVRQLLALAESSYTLGGRQSSQRVDQNGRIE